ncbi:MAG: hypothetical protein A3J35_02940 [Gammaproteobacteria bacterium RIFCSPLOWO2_02_FULL_52_10]|nr:MAG: hypothetical protein A3J35_02940 [Gammaproteobacteria bacterium RIFCSPLOWO2_02_FULL_52_10]
MDVMAEAGYKRHRITAVLWACFPDCAALHPGYDPRNERKRYEQETGLNQRLLNIIGNGVLRYG